jgi:hypothetical protein
MSTADGTVIGTTQILNNGPAANRWNLVIMGDGYQTSQLGQYATDVQQFVTSLLTTPPFDHLQHRTSRSTATVPRSSGVASWPRRPRYRRPETPTVRSAIRKRAPWPPAWWVLSRVRTITTAAPFVRHSPVACVRSTIPTAACAGERSSAH